MRFNFKHIALSAALAAAAPMTAHAQAEFGATGQFLHICDGEQPTYNGVISQVAPQDWVQLSESGVVADFFPESANVNVENAAIYEFNSNNFQPLDENDASSTPTERWYLGVMKARVPEGLLLVCQFRSFDQNIEGLREDFEQASPLQKQKIDSPDGSEAYAYTDGTGRSFYNLWERKFGEGDYVFALGKTIFYPARSNN